jgi:integrase
VLAVISGICNWYAARDEKYQTPIVKRMRRSNPKESARTRVLNDDEIRAVWSAAESNGTFGAFIRLALLTAQRKEKIASMRWADITDGVWTIPGEKREKGNLGRAKLPQIALDIINAQPRFHSNPYVLAGRGRNHWNGFSQGKKAFDAKVPIPHWVIHDLRRTARTLMSRARVDRFYAERTIGHAIKGVEATYDRFEYPQEKAHALQALASLIGNIISPAGAKVLSLHR